MCPSVFREREVLVGGLEGTRGASKFGATGGGEDQQARESGLELVVGSGGRHDDHQPSEFSFRFFSCSTQ